MSADVLAPRCEHCGSLLHFFTQDGRAVQDCDDCGLSFVAIRHPQPVAATDRVFRPWARDAMRDALIVLMRGEDRSTTDIAEHFGLSVKRVQQILQQARVDHEAMQLEAIDAA